MQILYYLFPDALEDSPHPYPVIEKEKVRIINSI